MKLSPFCCSKLLLVNNDYDHNTVSTLYLKIRLLQQHTSWKSGVGFWMAKGMEILKNLMILIQNPPNVSAL